MNPYIQEMTTHNEVQEILKQMKSRKAAGSNGTNVFPLLIYGEVIVEDTAFT